MVLFLVIGLVLIVPLARARLDRGARELLPWAWGITGFASVLAAPLATAIGMTWGFTIAGALAMVLYLVPTILFLKLPCTPVRSAFIDAPRQ